MSQNKLIELVDAYIYQDNRLILSNVDIQITKGEFVYLIGKVGSGKSSLIKTLYSELPLQKGEGQVSGYDLTNMNNNLRPYLRRKLGIVFQDFQLLTDRSVHENLKFVLEATGWQKPAEIQNRIIEVLNTVGLKDKEFKMPFELSGGEQQRIVIARALLNDPEIILADEPTGNLDPATSISIVKILNNIVKDNKSVFMATHDYDLIEEYPARVLQCVGGKVVDFFS